MNTDINYDEDVVIKEESDEPPPVNNKLYAGWMSGMVSGFKAGVISDKGESSGGFYYSGPRGFIGVFCF